MTIDLSPKCHTKMIKFAAMLSDFFNLTTDAYNSSLISNFHVHGS
jgi:hypothetical protein